MLGGRGESRFCGLRLQGMGVFWFWAFGFISLGLPLDFTARLFCCVGGGGCVSRIVGCRCGLT